MVFFVLGEERREKFVCLRVQWIAFDFIVSNPLLQQFDPKATKVRKVFWAGAKVAVTAFIQKKGYIVALVEELAILKLASNERSNIDAAYKLLCRGLMSHGQ